MKALVVVTQYPSENDLYKNGFVHSRMKVYQQQGIDVEVYVYNNREKETSSYIFEGVNVTKVNVEGLAKKIRQNDYDVIMVHFAWKKMTQTILQNKIPEMKVLIWVHGIEALHWKRRLFNFSWSFSELKVFSEYVLHNTRQMAFYKELIRHHIENNIHFVFVSEWMKDIAEEDTKQQIDSGSYSIIPNPINTNIFYHEEKEPEDRKKIYNLRPYSSKKYANDITRDIILSLSKKDYFEDLEFHLYGKGVLFDELTAPLRKFKNVKIEEGFYTQEEIKQIHQENGIALMPTRQDAQGVSMCEAICSGLVPVVSDNTAIPEFVDERYGYLCTKIEDYVEAIEEMYFSPDIFLEKSRNTIILSEKLGEKEIEKEEIKLITNFAR